MIGRVAALTIRQIFPQLRCWLPITLLLLAAAGIARGGMRSLYDYYHSPAVLPVLILLPLFVCAGIVNYEVASGRALLIHSLGVTRQTFVLGRVLGGFLLCLGGVLIAHLAVVGAILRSNAAEFKLLSACLVVAAFVAYFAYMASLLSFLSSIIRAWGNSAAAFGLMFGFGVLNDLFADRLGVLGPDSLRLAKLFFAGPMKFVMQAAQGEYPAGDEVGVVVLLTAILLGLTCRIYGRSELGKAIARE